MDSSSVKTAADLAAGAAERRLNGSAKRSREEIETKTNGPANGGEVVEVVAVPPAKKAREESVLPTHVTIPQKVERLTLAQINKVIEGVLPSIREENDAEFTATGSLLAFIVKKVLPKFGRFNDDWKAGTNEDRVKLIANLAIAQNAVFLEEFKDHMIEIARQKSEEDALRRIAEEKEEPEYTVDDEEEEEDDEEDEDEDEEDHETDE